MRSMRKKAVVWVIVCTALAISAVAAFFELVVFTPAQQRVSIDQIGLNPDAWVNKEVVVEGNLTGPFIGYDLLWNFELSSNESTIGVRWNVRDGTANGSDFYDSVSVKVFGVFTIGRSVERGGSGYYIDAERIDRP